ncbi:MAG: putative Ig domain-containing protein [Planctomycetia bacterium]|nr:putative Ig domain-containing protein [Planctomycetia bacterium]
MKFSTKKKRRRFARRPWQMVLELLEDRTLLAAPVIIPIADQYMTVNTGFVLPVSAVDTDDVPAGTDPVNLSARLSDGGLLPGWLTFSAGFGTGTGTFTSTGTVGSIDVIVTATDSTGATDTDTFTIVATPAAGTLTATSPLANQTAGVHTPFSLSALGVFTDSTGDTITLSATKADGTALPSWLTFTPATGEFSGTPLDGDVGSVDVKLTATTLSDQAAAIDLFSIIVPLNHTPQFTKGADVTVLEDAGSQSVAGWGSNISGGPNEATQTVNFTVTTNNDALFSVLPAVSANGTLTFTPATNANGTIVVTVTAVDDGGVLNGGINTSASQSFNIIITAVNDAPSLTIVGNPATFVEEAALQTIPGFVTSVSTGPADEVSQVITNYSISQIASTGGLMFSSAPTINPVTGTLTYQPAANSSGTATFSVIVSDDGGTANNGVDTSSSKTFVITVTAVNDAPTFVLNGNPAASAEDAGVQIVNAFATDISAGAPNESGQTLTFTLTSLVTTGGLTFFVTPTIDPVTGNLAYQADPDSSGTATFSVVLSDNGGGADTSAAQYFTITVNEVNDAPIFTIAGNPATVLEDAGLQTVPNFVTSVSVGPTDEASQSVAYYTITQVATTGGLTFLAAPSVNPVTGTLTYQSDPNANGTATFSISVTDNGGTANGGIDTSSTQTFIISVTAVNDVPSFLIASNPPITLEDAGLQIVPGFAANVSAGAPNESGQILTFNLTTITITGGLTFIAAPTIDPVTGSLTYQADQNSNGTISYSVTLSDNGGGTNTSAAQFFMINVLPVNDVPTFVLAGNPPTVSEDAGAQSIALFGTSFSAGPANESSQTLTLLMSQTSSTGGLTFLSAPRIDLTTGTLTYQAAADANGSATYSVSLMDNGGTTNGGSDTSATQTFTVTITAVNDVPKFTITANPPTVIEDAGAQSVVNFATNISAGPANESTQVLTFLVTQTASTGGLTFVTAPSIDPLTGTLTYKTTADLSGTATFSVVLKDDGGIANGGDDTTDPQTFTITVLSVNDAPSFAKGPNWADLLVGVNDGPYTIASWVTGMSPGPADESSQALDFIITTNNPGLFSVLPTIDVTTGTLRFTPLDGFGGTATISVQLHDNGGTANGGVDTSMAQTFTITSVVKDLVYTSAKSAQLVTKVVNGELKIKIGGVPYSSYQTAHVETLTLNGGSNNDVINLIGLSPTVYPKLKSIVINGGAGKDAITMTASSTNAFTTMLTVTVNGGTGNDVINFAGLPGSLFPNSTSFIINGDAGNDAIYGSESAETISGGDGNDTIRGGAGNDSISGGLGNDILQGGLGNDSIDGGAGNDSISGQAGDDLLLGSDGNDTILGGLGNDTLKGGSGNDLLIGGAGIDNIDGEAGKDTALGGKGSTARGGNSHSDIGDLISAEIINEAFSKLFAFE